MGMAYTFYDRRGTFLICASHPAAYAGDNTGGEKEFKAWICYHITKRASTCGADGGWSYHGRNAGILYLYHLHAEISGQYSTSQQRAVYAVNFLANADLCLYSTIIWDVK